ncbi:hypothetical protein SH1V18_38400 [Vallitalea longa]|uniref:Uncharacterized protein n=1 Tax=Vallitalea longa TaxID=2936439 RepID=A0A9W5YC96_9FIRM|nr:hypothetical protein [Vallitalea longa]GKX31360.1 hypothetical protein SH1V18_38400 [Vallitalea longa]
MKDKLIRILARDLKVNRFTDESECEYNERLIYSAGAAWAKTLVYGRSYADSKLSDSFINTDIMYIETHLSKVLEAYLRCFDINLDWIKSTSASGYEGRARALASQIIKEVMYTYNLAQILSRRITSVKTSFYKYADNLYLIRGNVLNEKNVYSVGVAQWRKDDNLEDYMIDRKIINVAGKDYYSIMDKEFNWKDSDLNDNYLIFKLGYKGGYSKCWKPIKLNEIPLGISIIRLANAYNGGYILVKKNKGKLRIVELEPWYIEQKEIYRILYALNYKNGTPAEFKVKKKDDYYILRCSGGIPSYEDRIITCCSWPYMTFNNKYLRIIPCFLWEVVEKQINKLGIKLVG